VSKESEDRARRLAVALRDNLRKRKEQTRAVPPPDGKPKS
jgi:hypothetical protein